MSEQADQSLTPLPRPSDDNHEAWLSYWREMGQPWRTEPEIDTNRQKRLAIYRSTIPNIKGGIHPFKGVKLSRADVEWLLATHENGRGAVDWSDESQRERRGLDLRGADLCHVDLSKLPLARMLGGLPFGSLPPREGEEYLIDVTNEQRHMAAVLMEGTILMRAHLEGAVLNEAHLPGADLSEAQLREASLVEAQMEKANLSRVQLQEAFLPDAWLQEANLSEAQLQRANLIRTHLEGANLFLAHLEEANLSGAQLQRARLDLTQLQGADLTEANLEKASLQGARLERATLARAQLQGADLSRAYLKGAILVGADLEKATLIGAQLTEVNLRRAHLEDADLCRAQLQGAILEEVALSDEKRVGPRLADVRWSDVNLTVVDWSQVKMLGDEREARQKEHNGQRKNLAVRLGEYEVALRANRQLAVALQAQGLNEHAARFAYQAQCLGRGISWFQMLGQGVALGQRMQAFFSWAFSWFLNVFAGYGYRPERCFVVYVLALIAFTIAHYMVGIIAGSPLTLLSALAVSIQSLHGRIFSFPSGDPQTLLNTIEAFVGLFIEAIVVAVITQRILGK